MQVNTTAVSANTFVWEPTVSATHISTSSFVVIVNVAIHNDHGLRNHVNITPTLFPNAELFSHLAVSLELHIEKKKYSFKLTRKPSQPHPNNSFDHGHIYYIQWRTYSTEGESSN